LTWFKVDQDTEDSENVPPPRSYHTATRVGKNLFVVGGKRGVSIMKDVWILSDQFIWSKTTGIQPPPHSHHTTTRIGSQLILMGGLSSTINGSTFGDIWIANTVVLPLTASTPQIDYKELKVEQEIGVGNFSKVYKGIWKGNEVAIKKITVKKNKDPEIALKEFKSEVELLSSISYHPNLVTLFGHCISPQCIVMEFLPWDLFGLIQSIKIDQQLLFQFAEDIASGMSHLHRCNIIHRDLKSSNILLNKHLNVKIADLGIARQKSVTSTMTTIGTVAWTAPEILRHEPYNEKCDVYSYAIVIWEMITAKIPYDDMTAMNAGIAVASKQLRPIIPDETDEEWARLMQLCWEENPDERLTFEQVLEYLKQTF